MQFRLVRTGRSYSKSVENHAMDVGGDSVEAQQGRVISPAPADYTDLVKEESIGTPVIWRGTADEYLSLLVLREAELVVAKAQLTGNDRIDWYAKNRILDLEIKISDLRSWLAEARQRGDMYSNDRPSQETSGS
jgi:hypothetical protein